MIALINTYLRGLSPSYRAARDALRQELARRVGVARYHARRSMIAAAMVEAACPDGFKTFGPGFLPPIVWRTLPLMSLARRWVA